MTTIVIVGGTGYTGANIAREAASRGHAVVSISRSQPSHPVPGVRYELGDAEELAARVIPDFGPMATAETRAQETGKVFRYGAEPLMG